MDNSTKGESANDAAVVKYRGPVTGEQVKAACEKGGLTRIDHHDCGGCGYMTAYIVEDGELYFDAGCDCSRYGPAPFRPCGWGAAADWINMQKRSGQWGDIGAQVAAKFGIELEDVGDLTSGPATAAAP
jgi:hypothetical protein